MTNPFRSEAEAYRFVWLTIGYFALIVAGSFVSKWLGLAVFVVLTVGMLAWIVHRRRERPVPTAPRHRGGPDVRRILVIANETVGGEALREEIRRKSEGYTEQVLVVCPALNTRLRRWASDEDAARAAANERLAVSLASLREAGIDARGEIGDGDPVQAIEDSLRLFGADEVIVSTHPPGRSNWLEKGVVDQARERFAVPITHVVVDLEAEREGVEG